MAHRVYQAIMTAVISGALPEPFTISDFRSACPGFADTTYRSFLAKHEAHNPGGESALPATARRGHV
jgi:hypothetical protein